MKKIFVAIVAIIFTMTMVISASDVTIGGPTSTDDHGTSAMILDSDPEITYSWIEILDGETVLYDSSAPEGNLRLTPYIWEGETLVVYAEVYDTNGEDDLRGYADDLYGYLLPEYGTTIDMEFDVMLDDTSAQFSGELLIPGPNVLRCAHQVWLDDDEEGPYMPYLVFEYLYINPEVTADFSPIDSIAWTSSALVAGADSVPADDNTYTFTLLSVCENTFLSGPAPVYDDVAVDYTLEMAGTDLASESSSDVISVNNIQYSLDGVTPTSVTHTPTMLGSYVGNTGIDFDFYLTVPAIIDSGEYTGDIIYYISTL